MTLPKITQLLYLPSAVCFPLRSVHPGVCDREGNSSGAPNFSLAVVHARTPRGPCRGGDDWESQGKTSMVSLVLSTGNMGIFVIENVKFICVLRSSRLVIFVYSKSVQYCRALPSSKQLLQVPNHKISVQRNKIWDTTIFNNKVSKWSLFPGTLSHLTWLILQCYHGNQSYL